MNLKIKSPKDIKKQDILKYTKNIILTVLGTAVLAFGIAVFVLPYDLLIGGISSYAIAINNLLPALTVEQYIFVLTWGLFILGLIILGINFGVQTLVSTIVYPFAVAIFGKLVSPDVLNGIFYIKDGSHKIIPLIIATVLSGIIVGAGCAITYLGGGSTGGTDVISFIICKFFKRLRTAAVIFCVDSFAILISVFVLKNFIVAIFGVSSALISAFVINAILTASKKREYRKSLLNNE